VDSFDRTDLAVSARTKLVIGSIMGIVGIVLLSFFT